MYSMKLFFIACLAIALLSAILTLIQGRIKFDLRTSALISVIASAVISTLIIYLQRKRMGYKWFVENRPVERDCELMRLLQIEKIVPAKNYVLVKSNGRTIGHAYAKITDVPYLIDDLDREKKLWYVGNFARILSTLTFAFEIIPRLIPVSTEAYLRTIQKEIENLRLTISAEGSTRNPSREARLKYLEKLNARLLEGEGARDVGFLVHIMVEGKNEADIVKQLESNMKILISSLESGLGIRAKRLEGWQMLEAIQEFFRASGTTYSSKPCRLLSWDVAYLIPFTRPKMPQADKLLGGVYLGRTNTEAIVCLDLNKYANPHLAILGKSGFGKSTTVKTFMSRLFDLTGTPILIIDYAGEHRDFVESRSGTILDMRKDRINPFELGGAMLVDRIRQVVDAFIQTCELGTINQRNAFADYVTEAYKVKGFELNRPETWNRQPPTLLDVIKLMNEDLVDCPALKRSTIQSLIMRLQVLASGPFGVYGHSTVSIEQLTRGLTCVDLSKVTSNKLKDLIAWTILQYLDTMMRLEGVQEDVRLVIVLDEAWKLCKDVDSLPVTIVKEGRKYGYALCVSTQDVIDVAEPILSNAGTVIIHHTEQPRYLSFFKRAFDLTKQELSRLRNLPVGEALVKLSIDPKPFFVKVEMEKVTNQTETAQPNAQLIYSAEKEKIRPVSEEREKIRPEPLSDSYRLTEIEKRMLKLIAEGSVYSVSECYQLLAVNSYQGNKAKRKLFKNGLIEAVKLPTLSKGRRPKALQLTEKGISEAEKLGLKVAPLAGRKGGVLHRYLIDLITKEFLQRDCKVETEFLIGGGKTVDLVVNKEVAVEVETGYSDIEANIEKLVNSHFDTALIMCASKSVKHRVKEQIKLFDSKKRIIATELRKLPALIDSIFPRKGGNSDEKCNSGKSGKNQS